MAVVVANHKGEKCHLITLVAHNVVKVHEGSYPTKAYQKVPHRHAQAPAGERDGRMPGCLQKCGSRHPPYIQVQPDVKVSPYQIKSRHPWQDEVEKLLAAITQ